MMDKKTASTGGKLRSWLLSELQQFPQYAGWYATPNKLAKLTSECYSELKRLVSESQTDADTSETDSGT